MASLSSPESPAPRRKTVNINRVEKPSEEHEELEKMAHDAVEETRRISYFYHFGHWQEHENVMRCVYTPVEPDLLDWLDLTNGKQPNEEVFSSYACHSLKHPNIVKHPGDIVEAGCLAAQLPPKATYDLFSSVPEEVVKSGQLSDLQLEGILYACQRHQMILPNGQRAGFFIGDGAGVGKGRQIAGLILDNYARGRCKHIWFSISTDLRMDAQRDLKDIGCFVKVIDGCRQLDRETKVFGLPADFKEGIVFSTYSTLVSSVQRGSARQTRLQQLLDWCGGEEFEGCLIFDECHKAKHFIPGKEESSTKVAVAVTTLQRMLPRARVLYCSATGVTDVKNMAFMERLGLWGEGTAFRTFDSFLEGITKRGLGASEMLAMEMKASGMYVSRGLSFRQAEFVTIEAPLSPEQIRVYNTAVHVWEELKKSLQIALTRTNTASPRIWSLFWSSHQRFFKQLCMSMKVPKIVEEAKAALNGGFSVVIGLQTTGEASLESELSNSGGSITRFVSITEESLRRFIAQYFPTQFQNSSTKELKEDKWCASAKELLLGFVKKINLPVSSLDDIIDQLGGPSCVAEMTGRRGRVVRTSQNSQPRYETRESDSSSVDSLNIQERNSFMNGTKLVSIISDAASTGISLHADLRAANQRRRVHLTIELAWSADKAVQQLGRSHRSNQSSGPVYKLVTTNLGGERRFAAAVARRLQSLGALTKGDRRAATGADLTQFNFNTPYGRSALRNMYQAISMNHIFPGVSLQRVLEASQIGNSYDFLTFNDTLRHCLILMDLTDSSFMVKEKEAGDVSRFLNRILGLSVEKQNLIFAYFSECLVATTEAAKREGRYNEGVTDITGSSIAVVGQPQPVFVDVNRGLMSTKLVTLNVDRGVDWESAVARYETARTGKHDGFYCSKREQKGRRLYLLAISKGVASHLFSIIRPNTGMSPFEENQEDLHLKYMAVSPEEAEAGWREQYERTARQCIHGVGCKAGITCRVGARITQMHLLCGGIVPLLSTLELAVARNAEKLGLSKSERTLRVVRVELNDGQRLVGLRYPEVLIAEVTALLSEQKAADAVLAKQNGVLGLVVPSKPKTEARATVEPEASINARTLSRAINPPVTIKTFFRAKVKESKNTATDSDDENAPRMGENDAGDSGNCSEVESEVQVVQIRCDGKDGTVAEDSRVANSSGPRDCRNMEKGPFSSNTRKPTVKGAASVTSKPKKTKTKTLKRSSSSLVGNASKRTKQTSILTSFASGVSNGRLPAVKDIKCPICAKVFEQGTSNEELNKHIDSCLIE